MKRDEEEMEKQKNTKEKKRVELSFYQSTGANACLTHPIQVENKGRLGIMLGDWGI